MYSSKKEFFNKNQTEINLGASKAFYPTITKNVSSVEEDEMIEAKRQAKRKEMVDYIMATDANLFASDFYFPGNPLSAISKEETNYTWLREKLEDHDDVALQYKFQICENYLNNFKG